LFNKNWYFFVQTLDELILIFPFPLNSQLKIVFMKRFIKNKKIFDLVQLNLVQLNHVKKTDKYSVEFSKQIYEDLKMGIYDFDVTTIQGKKTSLKEYEGKVVLIVNTASKCGFTPQYSELEDLYKKYKDRGFVVLGFPCNQFAAQEPGSAGEITEFCRINYGVTFQIFEKGDVRGENAQPLFKYLTAKKGFKGFDMKHPIAEVLLDALKKNFPEYLEGDSIKWNFTKFLIDRKGEVVERFEPTTTPADIAQNIEKLL